MDDSDLKQDPKLKLFIRLPRDKFSQGQEDTVKQQLFDLLTETPVKSFEPRISSGYCFLHFENRLLAAQGHDKIFNKVVNGHSLRPCFGFTPAENQAVRAGIKDEEIERNHRTLFVKNLPAGVGQEEVSGKFSEWGEIAKVSVVKTRTGLAAFVLFKRFTPAIQCVEDLSKDGFEMQGPQGTSRVSVELSKNKNLSRRVEKFTGGGPMGPMGFMGRGGMAGPAGRGGFMPPGGRGWGAPSRGHSSQGPWAGYWSTGSGGWGESRGRGGSAPTWAPWMRGGAGNMGGGRGNARGGGRFGQRHRPY